MSRGAVTLLVRGSTLASKVDPNAERVKVYIMAVDL